MSRFRHSPQCSVGVGCILDILKESRTIPVIDLLNSLNEQTVDLPFYLMKDAVVTFLQCHPQYFAVDVLGGVEHVSLKVSCDDWESVELELETVLFFREQLQKHKAIALQNARGFIQPGQLASVLEYLHFRGNENVSSCLNNLLAMYKEDFVICEKEIKLADGMARCECGDVKNCTHKRNMCNSPANCQEIIMRLRLILKKEGPQSYQQLHQRAQICLNEKHKDCIGEGLEDFRRFIEVHRWYFLYDQDKLLLAQHKKNITWPPDLENKAVLHMTKRLSECKEHHISDLHVWFTDRGDQSDVAQFIRKKSTAGGWQDKMVVLLNKYIHVFIICNDFVKLSYIKRRPEDELYRPESDTDEATSISSRAESTSDDAISSTSSRDHSVASLPKTVKKVGQNPSCMTNHTGVVTYVTESFGVIKSTIDERELLIYFNKNALRVKESLLEYTPKGSKVSFNIEKGSAKPYKWQATYMAVTRKERTVTNEQERLKNTSGVVTGINGWSGTLTCKVNKRKESVYFNKKVAGIDIPLDEYLKLGERVVCDAVLGPPGTAAKWRALKISKIDPFTQNQARHDMDLRETKRYSKDDVGNEDIHLRVERSSPAHTGCHHPIPQIPAYGFEEVQASNDENDNLSYLPKPKLRPAHNIHVFDSHGDIQLAPEHVQAAVCISGKEPYKNEQLSVVEIDKKCQELHFVQDDFKEETDKAVEVDQKYHDLHFVQNDFKEEEEFYKNEQPSVVEIYQKCPELHFVQDDFKEETDKAVEVDQKYHDLHFVQDDFKEEEEFYKNEQPSFVEIDQKCHELHFVQNDFKEETSKAVEVDQKCHELHFVQDDIKEETCKPSLYSPKEYVGQKNYLASQPQISLMQDITFKNEDSCPMGYLCSGFVTDIKNEDKSVTLKTNPKVGEHLTLPTDGHTKCVSGPDQPLQTNRVFPKLLSKLLKIVMWLLQECELISPYRDILLDKTTNIECTSDLEEALANICDCDNCLKEDQERITQNKIIKNLAKQMLAELECSEVVHEINKKAFEIESTSQETQTISTGEIKSLYLLGE